MDFKFFSSHFSSVIVELCFGCAVAQCCHCYSPLIGTGLPSSCRKNFCASSAKGEPPMGIPWDWTWNSEPGAEAGMLQVNTWAICYVNASMAQLTPACVSSSLNNLLPIVPISRNLWECLPYLPLTGQHPRRSTGQSLK